MKDLEPQDPLRTGFESATAGESTPWPALPLEEWAATRATLHMWTQIVGKVRLALSPHVNHWWEVPLYVSARGMTTSPIPYGERIFEIEFDFLNHNLVIRGSDRATKFVPLYPRSVADFYREVTAVLHALAIDVKIWPTPVEVPDPVPFPDDDRNASYDPEYVSRFHRVLLQADAVFKEFRSRFIGKVSPVHFFWGSFDLAVTRFSGRRAPEREGADAITREAYSHECSSVGFWPGSGDVAGPAFYAYAVPEPPGYAAVPVRPPAAFYDSKLKEFILMYDEVRRAPEPEAALLQFCQSTYEAGANLAGWDRAALERSEADMPQRVRSGKA
ncbi:MAG TPA: DUF5996 family protein [Bryobacteraceae bacterium]|nr:DUF5996 family protein [Bryobacteraceae bacterium]